MAQQQVTIRSSEKRRRSVTAVIGFLVIVLLLICGLTLVLVRNVLMGTRREPQPVLAGVQVETVAELPGDRAYPDSISVGPDGNLYVSSYCEGDIWRITPDGELTIYFDGEDGIGAASGIAFAPDGSLWVIDGGSCSPRSWSATLKRIEPNGEDVARVSNIGSEDLPNALAFDSEGNLYLTDSRDGSIRRLDGETFITWWDALSGDASLTGLEHDRTTNSLITADTENGILYRVPIGADGLAGTPEVLVDNTDDELDGLTVDEQGRVFFTQYSRNQVAMWQAGFGVTILAKDFREPSDIAYLDGVLYITNVDSISLAPLLSLLIDPSLPFTVDKIVLPNDMNATQQ